MSARAARTPPAPSSSPRVREKRNLRPREPLAAVPLAVSDRTAPLLFGFRSPRSFREFVRRHRVPHASDGRTVIVCVDQLRRALARLAVRDVAVGAGSEDDHDDLGDATAILERLGVEPADGT